MLVCGIGEVEGSGYGMENWIGCLKGQGQILLENSCTFKNLTNPMIARLL